MIFSGLIKHTFEEGTNSKVLDTGIYTVIEKWDSNGIKYSDTTLPMGYNSISFWVVVGDPNY